MTGDAEDHSPQSCQPGLNALKAWFQDAAAILDAAARAAGAEKPRIILLPQTLHLRCAPGLGAKSSALGFSPGDDQSPEPYFYAYSTAPKRGAQNPKLSVVSGSTVLAQDNPATAASLLLQLTG